MIPERPAGAVIAHPSRNRVDAEGAGCVGDRQPVERHEHEDDPLGVREAGKLAVERAGGRLDCGHEDVCSQVSRQVGVVKPGGRRTA